MYVIVYPAHKIPSSFGLVRYFIIIIIYFFFGGGAIIGKTNDARCDLISNSVLQFSRVLTRIATSTHGTKQFATVRQLDELFVFSNYLIHLYVLYKN